MQLYQPTITGSLLVSGSIVATGGITVSGSIASASFAASASNAVNAATASFVTLSQTASFVTLAQTASFVANAQSASNAVTAQTASYANALTVAGTLTAQTLVVQTITSSVDFVTGSTRFGSLLANTHLFTGSVGITGSLTSNGAFSGTSATFSGNVTAQSTQIDIILNATSTSQYSRLVFQENSVEKGGVQYINSTFSTTARRNKLEIFNSGGVNFITQGNFSSPDLSISSTGAVGVGTTSPSSRLNVAGSKTNSADLTNVNNQLTVTDLTATAAGVGGRISFLGSYTSTPDYFALGTIEVLKDNANNYGGASWNNAAMRFIVGNNDNDGSAGRMLERMRITSAGNVGIGTSSPRGTLDVVSGTANTSGEAIFQALITGGNRTSTVDLTANLTIQTNDAMAADKGGSLAFGGRAISSSTSGANWAGIAGLKTNGTSEDYTGYLQFWTRGGSTPEKMRITSVGSVLLGTTTNNQDVRLQVASSGGVTSWISGTFAGTGNGDKVVIGNYTGVGPAIGGHNGALTAWSTLTFNFGGGAVYAGTQRIDNNSDERIKKNIQSIDNALSTILSLKGRKFNMIDENDNLRYGFVAQEVQPYLSDFVTESTREYKDENVHIENLLTLENSGTAWAALLIEAIKEQQAQIEELKARLT